jgi:SynChlorMet cassette radical SAM/SPASM protein ScmF
MIGDDQKGEKFVVNSSTKIIAKSGVVFREEQDKWGMLYHPGADFSFALDPVCAFIWNGIEHEITVSNLIQRVKEDCESGADYEDEEIIEFLKLLLKRDLAVASSWREQSENAVNQEETLSEYPLEQIYFYLTEGCNLACRHCWLSPKLQTEENTYPMLSVDIFRSVVEQAIPLGLKRVKLTGGEPLMHPEISKILSIVKEFDLGLSIETNGVLCTPELAKEIASCKSVSISISLDGSDAESHEWVRGIKGCFDASVEAFKNLRNAGIRAELITTVFKNNRHQLEDIVKLAESLGARSVKLNALNPAGRAESMSEKGQALSIREMLDLGEWVESTLVPRAKVRVVYDIPHAFHSLSSLFGENGRGNNVCGIMEIIGVLSNGHYALCGIGNHFQELVFGNAATDPLEEVWKHSKILNELREGIPKRLEGICGQCLMNNVCYGACIAQNYYSTKNLWKSFWVCDEAHKIGAFPKTRMKPK